MKSENFVEKKFLYLILFSILLHAALFALLLKLPAEKKQASTEPLMVDLQDIPAVKSLPPAVTPPARRQAEERQSTSREIAPKGDSLRDLPPQGPETRKWPDEPPISAETSEMTQPAEPQKSQQSPGELLFRKRSAPAAADTTKLYPDASKLARLEEIYRKKYGPEVAEGETRFLNTDDILFGSFLRRFETAVYGVWRYPAEAASMGIEGMTPVKITFNRRGEIVGRELLQSSGSRILDNEVLRTLDQLGPVGSFPRNYDKDTFNLIAFFHYGMMQGGRRSLR